MSVRGMRRCGMASTASPVAFRRLDGPRRFRLFGTQRRYEVHFDDGSTLVVAPTALDRLMKGRQYPADYWACVEAADAAHAVGDLNAVVEWPTGKRRSL